jgi:hypothetical protein
MANKIDQIGGLSLTSIVHSQSYIVELPAGQMAVFQGCERSAISEHLARHGVFAEPRDSSLDQPGIAGIEKVFRKETPNRLPL